MKIFLSVSLSALLLAGTPVPEAPSLESGRFSAAGLLAAIADECQSNSDCGDCRISVTDDQGGDWTKGELSPLDPVEYGIRPGIILRIKRLSTSSPYLNGTCKCSGDVGAKVCSVNAACDADIRVCAVRDLNAVTTAVCAKSDGGDPVHFPVGAAGSVGRCDVLQVQECGGDGVTSTWRFWEAADCEPGSTTGTPDFEMSVTLKCGACKPNLPPVY